MFGSARLPAVPALETVRKHAHVLVIDDHELPSQDTFERDGYHFERWAEVKNLSQLTDGHFHLILLDIQGVGLNEDPHLQGLGILRHIKRTNPSQPVIIYSSQNQNLAAHDILALADAHLDKAATYLEYKEQVDTLLVRRSTPGYFLAVVNRDLGDQAALVPHVAPKVLRALGGSSTKGLERYLRDHLPDPAQIDRILTIVSIGASTASILLS